MADGPDVLVWRIAADAMNLTVSTTRGLCRAAEQHPHARPLAEKRIATLRSMGSMLMSCADEFDAALSGSDARSLEEIVESFSQRFGEST